VAFFRDFSRVRLFSAIAVILRRDRENQRQMKMGLSTTAILAI